MPVSQVEKCRRWRQRYPEKVRASNKGQWAKYKQLHPEIGTRENPRNDTRFKKGNKRPPNAGRPFEKGHKINLGRKAGMTGKVHTAETKAKLRQARLRQVITEETILKMSQAHRARRETNHFWRGGITEGNKRLRNRYEMKAWRRAVFKRDDYTCQSCKKRGVYLHAHHIKPFSKFPELRFDLANGQTLCVDCHKETDSYLYKAQRKVGYA